jgi:hypothetical protein
VVGELVRWNGPVRFGVGCDDGCVFGDELSLWKRRSPR